MKKLFPPMYDCPEWQQVMMGGFYWVVYFFLLPALLNLIWMAIAPTDFVYAWICVAYYVLNALAVAWIFWDYLKESFWIFRYSLGSSFKTILWGLLALAVLQIPVFLVYAGGDLGCYVKDISPFPVADTLFQVSPKASMDFYPGLSAPFFVTLVPFTMSALYLTVGFAPATVKYRRRGYLIVAALAWVSCLFIHLYSRDLNGLQRTFFVVLPFWLCGCWVYQKTDTIWVPMIFHAAVNLIGITLYLIV